MIFIVAISTFVFFIFYQCWIESKKKKEIQQRQSELENRYYRLYNRIDSPITRSDDLPNNYVVLDIETTGLDPYKDDIIEIALIEIKNRIPVRQYKQLIKPRKEISYKITSITGITNLMVQNSPYIENVINDVLEFIGDNAIMGYNVDFDMRFLIANSPILIHNHTIDTLAYARRWIKDLPSYKLKEVAKSLNVENPDHHRALNDCFVTQQCFEILRRKYEVENNIVYTNDKQQEPSRINNPVQSFISTNNSNDMNLKRRTNIITCVCFTVMFVAIVIIIFTLCKECGLGNSGKSYKNTNFITSTHFIDHSTSRTYYTE